MRADDFLVVGLGASAGGIQAIQQFLRHLPPDSDLAFVVVLHLSPDYDSQLAEVLQGVAPIPVVRVGERARVQSRHVYVVSPRQSLAMDEGDVVQQETTRVEERRAPIDVFFRTLADSHGPRAVCIILSGTGADGSLGLKRIRERGGICLVQDPEEAEHPDMPRSAIATGLVDEVLPVAEMPGRLLAYRSRTAQLALPGVPEGPNVRDQRALQDIFSQLRLRTGHDFSNYKQATVLRRIERRIGVRQLTDLASYATFIREHPEEAQALLKDLLISVTNFFRDPDAWAMLERDVIPRLFDGRGEDDQVRVWVPACATGEEAYSVGMLLLEHGVGTPGAPGAQIFATDIDEQAIAVAREGVYTLNDAADVSPERLRQFFNREGNVFRVRKELRELVLFAHHNIIKDPPFSHLDLISCRNLLIYLNRTAQQRVLHVLHFALKPGGYLFLGGSESMEGTGDLFATVNKEGHVFQSRGPLSRPPVLPVPAVGHIAGEGRRPPEPPPDPRARFASPDLHLRLLEQYAPPSAVVNEEHEIVHLSDRAGRYLQFAGGEPSHNLLKVVRPELRLELRTTLYQAAQQRTNVEARNLTVTIDGRPVAVNLLVRPVLRDEDPARGFFLVIFDEMAGSPRADVPAPMPPIPATEPARQLEMELVRLRGQLRLTVEQHETQAEELKASNEELQAINEELRSATEELETSKEELQSVNEELRTVNQELKIKVDEQVQASNDLQNLINSTEIGTVFLDRAGRIKLFTPRARDLFSLIPSDRGRPLTDITVHLVQSDLQAAIERVLDRLERIEREVETKDGRWHLMRIGPYRTSEDRIDGVVLTFVDITERRKAEASLRDADRRKNEFLATLAHELRNPLAPITTALQILKVESVPAPERERARQTIERQVAHMVRLVEDLLELSRITHGKIALRRQRIPVGTIVEAAVDGCAPLIQQRKHELTLHMPPAPLFVEVDPVRMSQVFGNLLNNAAKYTPEGGRISVVVDVVGDEARVTVRDNGLGIPGHILPHVFDLFTQGEHLPAGHAQSGLGIGLTLVRTLVQAHGGRVQARSSGRDTGSEFMVCLPLAGEANPPPSPVEAASADDDLTGRRVLVVDDNQDAASSLATLLSLRGARVAVAFDGQEALTQLAAHEPEVVFLDIGMPGMDGFEVARRLRSSPVGESVTLVALTGWGTPEDRDAVMAAGFDHHLTKPTTPEQLRAVFARSDRRGV